MTNEEKQAIVNEVLAALHTHGKTIGQLTPVTSPSDSDAFELSGGRNLSYGKLKELITAIFTAALTGYVPADSLWDYIQQYIAKLGTNGALDWQESPIVMLATMGTAFDNVDGELPAYTLQEGDMYYQYGVNYQIFRKLAQGSEGMPAKADVVYFNMRTWRTYKWTGSTMVEIAKPKSRVVLADLHTQNYNSMATGTIAYNPIAKKIVEKVTSTSWSVSDPDPDYIYCDAQTNTSLRWDATNSAWVQIGGGSGGSVLKDVKFEDGNLIFTFETEQGEQEITVPIEFDASNYVPITRTVNGKALSQDITIGQSDISGLTAALAALVPQTRTINGKALSSNVTIGMSDIQGLVDAINNAGSGAVSVTTNQDGTFVIHVGSTDYTINLNHTHENMAKLIVCEESDLPSTLDMDTIYAQVDDATDPGEIQSLWIAGLEFVGGGGSAEDGTPKMVSPKDGSTINLGENSGSGVSQSIVVKAKNLNFGGSSTGLTIEAIGTGLSLTYSQLTGQSSVTIPQSNGIVSAEVTVVFSGTGALANGELRFKQGSDVLAEVAVLVEMALPVGFIEDAAWNGENMVNGNADHYTTYGYQEGYVVTPFFQVQHTSSKIDLQIKAGFVSGTDIPKGIFVFKTNTNDNMTFSAYTQSTDPRRKRANDYNNQNFISATFKRSELANCYIYDINAGAYLFAGANIDQSTAPTLEGA